MSPEKLVENIKAEIESAVLLYSKGSAGNTDLGSKLEALGLTSEQREKVVALIRQAIEESTYGLICAFEGSASLNGSQEIYKITDNSGNEISGKLGEIFFEQVMA